MLHKPFLTAMAVSAFVLPVLSLNAKSALAEDLTFSLTNGTEMSLQEFYTSPSDVNNWEEDVLGSGTLESGGTDQVTIADGRTQCVYDIRGVFDDGTTVEHQAVDFCELDGGSYEFVQE